MSVPSWYTLFLCLKCAQNVRFSLAVKVYPKSEGRDRMNDYNLRLKADSLNQQLEALQAQKKLLDEQMTLSSPIVQNNYLPSQTPQYEFYGEYMDDIYNIKKIDERVIYMDKDEPVFMMNGHYYKFEEFEPKSEIELLKEENEKLKQQLKEKEKHESTISKEQQPACKYDAIPLEI